MRTDNDDERQPLLTSDDDLLVANTAQQNGWLSGPWYDELMERMPMFCILLVALLTYVCSQGPVSAAFDQTRALACAEYYQHHPPSADEVLQSRHEPTRVERLCSNDWIEGRSAQVLSITYVVGALCASVMVLFIEPRLHVWGRKRIYLVAVALMSVDRLTNMFLPVGYPYGLPAEQMAVSPVWVMRIWLAAGCIAGMLGSEVVPQMCLRLMITEVSSAGSKTSGLLGLSQMNVLSITFAPALTTWIGLHLPISAGGMDHWLSGVGHRLARVGRLYSVVAGHPLDGAPPPPPPTRPLPAPPSDPSSVQYNVGPFLVSFVTIIATIFIAIALLPPDLAAERNDAVADGSSSPPQSKTGATEKRESLFWRLWPRKDIDGKRDWRITLVVLVAIAHMASAYSINIFLQFFGHAYHWGPEAVALLVSSLGVTRMVTLFLIMPLFNAYFERKAKRPSALRHLSLDELRTLSKETPAVEAPVESAWEEPRPDLYDGEGEDDEDGRQSERRVMHSAVATWRAYVDRGVLAVSWSSDILGWSLVALFTLLGNEAMILVSSIVIAVGAAGLPVRMGVDLVIVSDVLARTAETPKQSYEQRLLAHASSSPPEQQDQVDVRADELYFSLLGFFDSLTFCVSPIVVAQLYKHTISSAAALNWLYPVACYSIALAVHFSMAIHQRSPQPTA